MRGTTIAAMLLACMATCAAYEGSDWPSWRGLKRDSTSTEKGWKTDWSGGGPKQLWSKQIGKGCSAFAVAGGRAFVLGNEKGSTDVVYAFDAKTGQEVWRHEYPCPLDPKYYFGGPSASPVVDGDKVYTLSKDAQIFCLNAADGKVVWQRDMAKEKGLKRPEWGYAGSPYIKGQALLLNLGTAGLCVDKSTGKDIWFSGADASGYATPVIFTHNKQEFIALFAAKGLAIVNPERGGVLSQFEWKTQYDVNAADPIVSGDTIFISSDYGTGCALVRIGAQGLQEVWRNKSMQNHMSPCVFHEGHLYGGSGNGDAADLVCIELATGAEKWRRPRTNGQGILAEGKLLHITQRGELLLLEASPAAYKELGRVQVFGGTCFTMPVLSHGLVYCRNGDGNAVCVDLRP